MSHTAHVRCPDPEKPVELGPARRSVPTRWCGRVLSPDTPEFLAGTARPRAAVMQNMLTPRCGQGVEDHSVWFAETLARAARAAYAIFTTCTPRTRSSGHQVRDFHKRSGHDAAARALQRAKQETYYCARHFRRDVITRPTLHQAASRPPRREQDVRRVRSPGASWYWQ